MTTIELTFPAGRYHATPWGRHVNEGAVEWPPSPYRFLRALVATWKRKASHLPEESMRSLLGALSETPEFALPPATFSHTRHYMPWYKKGPGDKTLVFDSFVAISKDAPIYMVWPQLVLDLDQSVVLEELLPLVGTLGRSESWCETKLLGENESSAHSINCKPSVDSEQHTELVKVLCVDPATAFENQNNPHHETTSGRGTKKVTTRTAFYEPDWHLCMETLWLHDQRWSMPPGAKWIHYQRRKDALAQPAPKQRSLKPTPRMQVARFAIHSTVLPLITDSLLIGEFARIALMSQYGWLTRTSEGKGKSRIFSGKEADGTPVSNHRHCYYLPTSELPENQSKGRIDHLTLYAADGFGEDELRAIDRLREIKTKDSQDSGHPLNVVLTGIGMLKEFKPGPISPSRFWISSTPFVAPRHPKTSGRLKNSDEGSCDLHRFLAAQLRSEIQRWIDRAEIQFAIDDVMIEILVDESGNNRRQCLATQQWRERSIQFRRFRQKRSDDGGRRPSAFFRLTFPEPVSGPIALGHSSHFGLGLFVPAP